jgi:hypothetical protein
MKKTFTLFLFLIVMIGLRAQEIPGYNFENWSLGDTLAPDGWQCHVGNSNGFHGVSKSSDHYEGSFSARLAININPGVDTIIGVLESKQPGGHEGLTAVYPVTSAHTSLKGFYKYTSVAGDSAQIIAPLFKSGYNNPLGYGGILAMAAGNAGAASTFTPFSIPYYYFSSQTPDSGYITIMPYKEVDIYGTASQTHLPAHGNSVLYIDALNYDTYITTGIDSRADITTNFSLYPSPCNGNIHVSFETLVNDFTTIKVYDLEAREIKILYIGQLNSGIQSFDFTLNDVPNGNYLFVLATNKGYRAEKFSVVK